MAGFAVVGLGVFFAGAALLYSLVRYAGIDPHVAYFITAVFSIEASFALNRLVNWRDRPGSLYRQLASFHVTKVATVILNQLLFAALLIVHVEYMIAMVLITGLITGVNYVTNDKFVFRHHVLPVVSTGGAEVGNGSTEVACGRSASNGQLPHNAPAPMQIETQSG